MTASAIAVIVAGGSGSRFGSGTPKQFCDIRGKPLLAHTIEVFEESGAIDRVVLVLPRQDFDESRRIMKPHFGPKLLDAVPGGDTRQASVWQGLSRIEKTYGGLVAVHDGARPLVQQEEIEGVVRAASVHGGAIVGVPVVETLKEVSQDMVITRTVDRCRYYRAQTPQCFRYEVLRNALEVATSDGFVGTDEASLVERLHAEVLVVPGNEQNLKVTTREDLEKVEYYLRLREPS